MRCQGAGIKISVTLYYEPVSGGLGCTQRVLSTYMVECRVSILGITIMVREGIPHNSTLDPLG